MSFEIFFDTYKHGEPCAFPLSEFESVFGAAIVRRELTQGGFFWRLEYPVPNPEEFPRVVQINGRDYPVEVCDCSEVFGSLHAEGGPNPTTDGFMVKGPATHNDFYVALLNLLQTTHSALFWPGKNALVIGQLESIEHLPTGMVETLGEPFLVTEPQQIIDRISAS